MKKKNRGLQELYMEIWRERPHYSELDGKWLGNEPNRTFFCHIIPKRTYPEYMLLNENIALLSFDQHQKLDSWRPERLVEEDPRWKKILDKAEELKARYEEEFGSKLRRK